MRSSQSGQETTTIPNTNRTVYDYMWDTLRYSLLSFTFIKEITLLVVYYILNHVKGMTKVHRESNTQIRPTVLLRDAERIFIGEGSSINHNNVLWAGKKDATIKIGKNVMTGPGVKLFAFNHTHSQTNIPMVEQGFEEADIIIEDDVWIGANSTVLAGANIGEGVIVGAGSVVTGDLPPYSVCAGVPAKVIKRR